MEFHSDIGTLFGGLAGLVIILALLIFLLTAGNRITGNVTADVAPANPLFGMLAIVAFAVAVVITGHHLKKF